MTNLDKAAELILPYIGGCTECDRIGDACLDCTREAKDAVKDIAEAGLLAPDLPDANDLDIPVPNGKAWLPCGLTGPSVWTAPGGRIMVQRVEPGDLTPAEARFFALAVLAAAQYAKGEENER